MTDLQKEMKSNELQNIFILKVPDETVAAVRLKEHLGKQNGYLVTVVTDDAYLNEILPARKPGAPYL